jgi:flagellar biosynthetic protein FliP
VCNLLALAAFLALCLIPASSLKADPPTRPASGQGRMTSNGGLSQVPDRVVPAKPRTAAESTPIDATANTPSDIAAPAGWQPDQMVSPSGLSGTLNTLLMLTVISIVPSILILTTCFVRFSIVLGLLRQALGTQQLPPNQVLMGLSFFLTVLVMWPVWQESYTKGIKPYTQPVAGQPAIGFEDAFANTAQPLRRFMSDQIDRLGNQETVWMFLDYQRGGASTADASERRIETYDDVPLPVLLPAYLLSELKAAFVIGFQIYLPFVIIDLVVAAVLVGMGLSMTPPTMISLPFKLLLFVLIDGWQLIVGMMLDSVRAVTG